MSLLLLFQAAAAAATSIGVPIDAGAAPPRINRVYYQTRSDPLYVTPVATTPYGWTTELSTAPPPLIKRPIFDTNSPLPFFASTAPTTAWQAPLGAAPVTTKAQVGFSSVPYNVAQVSVNYTVFGWHQPLSPAPLVAKAQAGFAEVPYNTAQVVVAPYTNFYFAPLSIAVPVARAIQSDPFVPYNTVQPVVVYPTGIPISSGDAPPRVNRVYYQTRFDPPYVAPVAVAGIAGMAWFTPLWTVPMRNLVVRPGDSFVPYNTIQAAVTTTPRRKPLLFIANVGRLMN